MEIERSEPTDCCLVITNQPPGSCHPIFKQLQSIVEVDMHSYRIFIFDAILIVVNEKLHRITDKSMKIWIIYSLSLAFPATSTFNFAYEYFIMELSER